MYKSYICLKCKKQLILLKEEISPRGYLKCPHCSSRNIKYLNENDNLKECMKHSSYKKHNGALRQVKHEYS